MLKEERIKQIEYVVNNSKYVKVNKEKLDSWIKDFACDLNYVHPWMKYKHIFSEKEIILLAFILESMNFCFWKEPIFVYKNKRKSEAMLNMFVDKALENRNLLDINYLINLKYEDLINLLEVEEGNLKNRYNSLMYTINKIYNNPNFYEELFSIKSTDDLYSYIITFDNFNDVSIYKGQEIKFYKRATLLVCDLFELSDTIHNNIKDIQATLGCADYVIPRGLRAFGILEYTDELASKIDNGISIPMNSEYEVEIRAYTLWVIEYVRVKSGTDLSSALLDNLIWQFFHGQGGISHKTDTIFY